MYLFHLPPGSSVSMQKGPHNQIYNPSSSQQNAGYAALQQLNHGYHTRGASAGQAAGVAGPAGASAGGGASRW